MSVEFQGFENFIDRLQRMVDAERLTEGMGRACAIVERAAKQKAPKGNGELRRSIKSKVTKEGGDIKGIVFTPLEYAPYVEYGTGLFAEEQGRQDVPWCYKDDAGEWHTTSGMPPSPYMRPALDENREQIKRILEESITND